jgi:hypothetical protein
MPERQLLTASAFVRDGQLYLSRRNHFDEAIARWSNCQALVRLEQVLDARSLALNAYYWHVVVGSVSGETGFTPAESHHELKALHLPKGLHAMRGGSVCWRCARVIDGSTRFLSGREEWQYIEDIHIWSAERLGLVIPDPVLA